MNMNDDASEVTGGKTETNHSYLQALESNQICLQLADEIKALRNNIISLKEDKRTWILSSQALQSEVAEFRNVAQLLKLEVMQLNQENISLRIQLTEKNQDSSTIQTIQHNNDDIVRKMESKHKCLADLLVVEKKKSRLLGRELEQSLGDELAVRSHCLRLETEIVNIRTNADENSTAFKKEMDLRKQLETCVESHVAFQHKITIKLRSMMQLLSVDNSSTLNVEKIFQSNGRVVAECLNGDAALKMVKIVSLAVDKLLARYKEARVYMKRLVGAVRQYEELFLPHSAVEWQEEEEKSNNGDDDMDYDS